jgi:uncharacterized membrane protein HdeD (DUF308 family)
MNEENKQIINDESKEIAGLFGAMSTASIVYGIILIIISMFLFISPEKSYVIVTTLLGVYLVVKGLIDFIAVFNTRNPRRGMTLFSSAVSFIAGFIVLAVPVFSATFLTTFAIFAIGISFIIAGFTLFKESIPMAIINIIIGIMMFFFTAGVAVAFVWIIAFLLLLGGVFSIVFGAQAKNVVREIKG